jgi:hypothetical protein
VRARRAAKRVGIAVLILVLLFLAGQWFWFEGETATGYCTLTASGVPGATQGTTDFTLFPPGFDCVYLDGNGQEIARRRAPS